MIHAGRKAKIKIIRESYIFISAVKKRKGKGKNQQITTEAQSCRGEILLEQVILNDLIQPHSEIHYSYDPRLSGINSHKKLRLTWEMFAQLLFHPSSTQHPVCILLLNQYQ